MRLRKGVKEILYNKNPIMSTDPKLIDKLSSRLPEAGRTLLDAACKAAEKLDLRLFLVGGSLRDQLMERDSLDLDLAAEGDAARLARAIAKATTARLVKTTVFGTATLKLGGVICDLAATRAETYSRPGALPKVRPSDIDADLLRRDFTLNAMALELVGPWPAKLFDPSGGIDDLRRGRIRVIHDRSFRDDATRIIRGVRFHARFGFPFEEATRDLLMRDLPYLDSISGTRIRQEMDRTFQEEAPAAAIDRLHQLGVLEAVHPSLNPPPRAIDAVPSTDNSAIGWALLAFDIKEKDVEPLVRRVSLTRRQAEAVRAMPRLRALSARLKQKPRPSELDDILAPLPEAALLAYGAAAERAAAEPVRAYLVHHRSVRPHLRGDDLVSLGVTKGPEVAGVLELLRRARLDGVTEKRADEEAMVHSYLATRKPTTVG